MARASEQRTQSLRRPQGRPHSHSGFSLRGECAGDTVTRRKSRRGQSPFVQPRSVWVWREEGPSGAKAIGTRAKPRGHPILQRKGHPALLHGGVGGAVVSPDPRLHLSPEDNGGDATGLVIKNQHGRHNSVAACFVHLIK